MVVVYTEEIAALDSIKENNAIKITVTLQIYISSDKHYKIQKYVFYH